MRARLRIAVVADVHHGLSVGTKAGSLALGLADEIVRAVNDENPDLVVNLGDWINDRNRDTDLRLLREAAERFQALRAPAIFLLGNHDQVNLSLEDCRGILGGELVHRSLDISGWHLVFWYADSKYAPPSYLARREDIAWLETDLRATELPSIVFSHVPFDDASMMGNYYFETSPPGKAGYANAAEIRDVIQRSGKVVAAVAGHVHWNRFLCIDGTHYLTVQSLSETFTTHPHPAAAWAMLELHDGALGVRVAGRDPASYVAPVRNLGNHWLSRKAGGLGDRLPSTPMDADQASKALTGVRGIILDLDGVVYKGSVLLPGVHEFLSFLRATGRRVVCVTNHSAGSAVDYARKLERLGVLIPADDILTSAQATARYVQRLQPRAKVFAVGSAALKEELLSAGLEESTDAEYVVVGYDADLALPKLAEGTRRLLDGAMLIGTNADALLPTPQGRVPECGPILAFLEAASGQKATVVGKPNPFIIELGLLRLGLPKSETLIVGDTIETDIAAGLAAGIRTALVLTGNTASAEGSEFTPTVVAPDLVGLRALLEGV